MGADSVRELFRRAMADNDAAAMRAGVEGVNDYDGDVWNVALVWELDDEGTIVRDTRYYAPRSEPPEWRSQWVEPLD